ncbi:MAG: hypothetical protein JKY86_08470 [Gammaproteobacteria bacterium]|nr:hypothetical protein [Gammaproteobacteria bacterium]
MMGSPAKEVKTLSAEQQAGLVKGAEIYVKEFKQFKLRCSRTIAEFVVYEK